MLHLITPPLRAKNIQQHNLSIGHWNLINIFLRANEAGITAQFYSYFIYLLIKKVPTPNNQLVLNSVYPELFQPGES